ncbi:hypothetical protein ABG067_006062 [Albugo candida]
MEERSLAASGSSNDGSCSSEVESLGLIEDLDAEEQEAEGVAENIRRTFLGALRATQPDASSNGHLAMLVTRHAPQGENPPKKTRCRWPLTYHWAPDSDEGEESLWSEKVLHSAIEQLMAVGNQNLQQTQA